MEEQLSCKEVVELVTDYLEGTLPEDVRLQMERHLAGCDGCTNYLEQMRQTIRLTGELREESLTPQQRADLLRLFRDWQQA
jgi:anti-sigma factor RsiW